MMPSSGCLIRPGIEFNVTKICMDNKIHNFKHNKSLYWHNILKRCNPINFKRK